VKVSLAGHESFESWREHDHHDLGNPRRQGRAKLRVAGHQSHARQVFIGELKKYGMFVADNGIDWAISVAPDERIGDLHGELRKIKGSAFEVVQRPQ